MKPSSAKAKGMKFQNDVKDKLCETLDIHPEDIIPTTAGVMGEDLRLARAARKKFPYSVECKHHKRFSIYKHYEQAVENAGDYEPMLIFRQNRSDPMVMVKLDHFLELIKEQKHTNQ